MVNEWPELYFLDDKQIGFQQADWQTSGKDLGGMPCSKEIKLVFSKLIGRPPGKVWVACLARRRSNEERRVALSVERFGSKFLFLWKDLGT